MSVPDTARVLLARAQDDLRMAGVLAASAMPAWGVGFHIQQAVEKAPKSRLALGGRDFPFTHDLRQLLDLVEDLEPLSTRFAGVLDYTGYAVAGRYGADSDAEGLDAGAALALAAELVDLVAERLAEADQAP